MYTFIYVQNWISCYGLVCTQFLPLDSDIPALYKKLKRNLDLNLKTNVLNLSSVILQNTNSPPGMQTMSYFHFVVDISLPVFIQSCLPSFCTLHPAPPSPVPTAAVILQDFHPLTSKRSLNLAIPQIVAGLYEMTRLTTSKTGLVKWRHVFKVQHLKFHGPGTSGQSPGPTVKNPRPLKSPVWFMLIDQECLYVLHIMCTVSWNLTIKEGVLISWRFYVFHLSFLCKNMYSIQIGDSNRFPGEVDNLCS